MAGWDECNQNVFHESLIEFIKVLKILSKL